jgi:hypothetical protein
MKKRSNILSNGMKSMNTVKEQQHYASTTWELNTDNSKANQWVQSWVSSILTTYFLRFSFMLFFHPFLGLPKWIYATDIH